MVLGMVLFCKAADAGGLFAALWRALFSDALPGSK